MVLNLPSSLDFCILGLSQLLIVLLCIDQHLLQVVQLRIQLLHLRVVRDRHGVYLPNWFVFLLDHGVHVSKCLLAMASDLILELHDLHGTFFSLVGQILPKLVDLVLFGFQLLFLLLQHLDEGLDGVISRISHFLAVLVMGALHGDSLLLLPIL